MTKYALVTGGNKGIGYATCRALAEKGFHVFLAARNAERGKAAAKKLQADGLDVEFVLMDVSSDAAITDAAKRLAGKIDVLDVLVNNAGLFLDQGKEGLDFDVENIVTSFKVNSVGPLLVTRAFADLLKAAKGAQVINVSSGMGQLDDMREGSIAYRISKTALNAVTCILASELSDQNVRVNSICPGWVKTDMGGSDATREPSKGAETIVWLAENKAGGATASFFRDMEQIPW